MKIMFVCTGNICRSPTAEAVLRHKAQDLGKVAEIDISSSGTHGYHIGEKPDPRAVRYAQKRGIDMSGLYAQKIEQSDFEDYDLLVAMDRGHYSHLEKLQPQGGLAEIKLFSDYLTNYNTSDIPDPYYGGDEGFDIVLDMVEEGCDAMLKSITNT
ncbi:MAG: low molecular weight protein-tyrosine-phosphatase [Pseudomonadota bacterium]